MNPTEQNILKEKKHNFKNYPFLLEMRKEGWVIDNNNKHIILAGYIKGYQLAQKENKEELTRELMKDEIFHKIIKNTHDKVIKETAEKVEKILKDFGEVKDTLIKNDYYEGFRDCLEQIENKLKVFKEKTE